MQVPLLLTPCALCLAAFLPGATMAQSLIPQARSGDLPALKAALPAGSDPDPESLVKPLYFASQQGHDEVVSYLPSLGAPPNAATSFDTALGIAARNNHSGIVATLLNAGADPDLPGGEIGKTALHQAVERGALEAARLLLDHGADVNAV